MDFNISLNNLQIAIEKYQPKALMLIHTYGCPADMDEITKIIKNNKMILIEDTYMRKYGYLNGITRKQEHSEQFQHLVLIILIIFVL